jgi:hypothetical protein
MPPMPFLVRIFNFDALVIILLLKGFQQLYCWSSLSLSLLPG